jgi:hypothetical protein
MAHRIEKNDKQQGVVMGWHGLTEIKSNLSLDDCWLNEWEPMPVVLDLNGKPTKWAVLRCSDNKELFIGAPYNPDTFTPIGNVEFLRMIKDSISGTPHEVVSVGSIRNRGRVFVSIKLNGMEKFKAAGRDFASFLNFGNGHDKSSVLWVNTSNTCTVCDNTFTANLVSVENKATAEADDNLSITKRHTKNVKLRLPELSKLIDRAVGVQAEFQLEMDKLAEVEIGRTDAVDLFAGFVGRNILPAARKDGLSTRSRNTASRLGELFVRGKGNRGETLADAFSAVTDYYTHESSGGDNIQRQIISSDYGAGNDAKRSFWGIVTAPELVVKTRSVGEELLANSKS